MSRILLVDDEAELRELLQEILGEEGYVVDVAEDGLVALEKLHACRPDLIVLDIMMPRMDGVTFGRELIREGLLPGIPIIVLTANGRPAQTAAEIGAAGFQGKPFDVSLLLRQIAELAPRT